MSLSRRRFLVTASATGGMVALHPFSARAQAGEAHLRILSDSSAARAIVIKRGPGRMKHLDIRYLWMQEGYRNEEFQIAAIGTTINWADALTKGLAGPRHRLLTAALGLGRDP